MPLAQPVQGNLRPKQQRRIYSTNIFKFRAETKTPPTRVLNRSLSIRNSETWKLLSYALESSSSFNLLFGSRSTSCTRKPMNIPKDPDPLEALATCSLWDVCRLDRNENWWVSLTHGDTFAFYGQASSRSWLSTNPRQSKNYWTMYDVHQHIIWNILLTHRSEVRYLPRVHCSTAFELGSGPGEWHLFLLAISSVICASSTTKFSTLKNQSSSGSIKIMSQSKRYSTY